MAQRQNKNKDESVDSELKKLTQEEWEKLYLQLRYFTFGRYKDLVKKTSILEDLIHDSIAAACSGERVCPPDVPILNFICGIITSKTSHYFEKEQRRAELNASSRVTHVKSQIDYYERENLRLDLSSAWEKVEDEIRDIKDEDLHKYHRSIKNDPDIKPTEIAEIYNLTVNEVKNVRKRYIRLVKKFLTA